MGEIIRVSGPQEVLGRPFWVGSVKALIHVTQSQFLFQIGEWVFVEFVLLAGPITQTDYPKNLDKRNNQIPAH
jgi:hypothetical protein